MLQFCAAWLSAEASRVPDVDHTRRWGYPQRETRVYREAVGMGRNAISPHAVATFLRYIRKRRRSAVKRGLGSKTSGYGMSELLDLLRLAWRLFREPRVPVLLKAIPLLGVLYLLWPVDVLPDVLPLLGQLDDLGVLLLAVLIFIRACPPDLVEAIRREMSTVSARYWVHEDTGYPNGAQDDGVRR